ncbi:MAG: DUF1344 domain-containing protein [Paenirhodobacter sp.]|uniref:DUF1344 domain-containing protein n=1 Tax=Paenirhodobacter sp. TaxID=1965326 RepID=UPI003D114271
MRSFLLPVVTVLALGSASLAMAAGATTTTGTIKTIDTAHRVITLADGSTYRLKKTFDMTTLKTGEKVSVSWELKGKVNKAMAVTPVQG